MTCHDILSLLDDYVDRELGPSQAKQVTSHLATCRSCQDEHQLLLRLKSDLQKLPAPTPRPEYWNEVTSLILAKTVEADNSARTGKNDHTPQQRRAFARALLSLAASLLIFFTAVYLGTKKEEIEQSPFAQAMNFRTGSMNLLVESGVPSTNDREQSIVTQGMILISPPGLLGRVEMLPELLALR